MRQRPRIARIDHRRDAGSLASDVGTTLPTAAALDSFTPFRPVERQLVGSAV
jgi:hypothetical protein